MRGTLPTVLVLALAACGPPPLTPAEQAAKDRSECIVVAIEQSGFDPTTAEEPPRTISSSAPRGGEVVGSGAIVKGAAKGAVAGVIGGAIMGDAGEGAAAGAAVGGLFGGMRRRAETKEVVTTTRPNPEHQEYVAAKQAYKHLLEECLASRAAREESR